MNYTSTCKWYLLEDDPDDVQLLQEAIDASGFAIQLLHFFDAETLFKQLSAEQLPDIVVLDINLPTANGIDILAELKKNERTQHLPVVMFTSSDLAKFQEETLNKGAVLYIRKPMQYNMYQQVVKEIYDLCTRMV